MKKLVASLGCCLVLSTAIAVTGASATAHLPSRFTFMSSSNWIAPGIQHFKTGTKHGVTTTITVGTLYENDNSIKMQAVQGAHVHFADLFLAAPDGKKLARGPYTDAQREPFKSAGHPGLSVDADGHGCNTLTGNFYVHQIRRAVDDHITFLDVTFNQQCTDAGSTGIEEGHLIYHG